MHLIGKFCFKNLINNLTRHPFPAITTVIINSFQGKEYVQKQSIA